MRTPSSIIKSLMPQSSRTAELYGLPKDHKPGVPLRPIVSACGDPLDKISQLLEKILSQLLRFIPVHLSNTDEYLRRLSDTYPGHTLPAGSIIFSVDVTNLYGNIPYREAIDNTRRLLEAHHQDIDMLGLDISDVTQLLHHCLSNNYLRFGDSYYRQTSGIAMGSRVAPPLAIIFMDSLKRQFNASAENKPDIFMRYIDDVLRVWTHGPDDLHRYLEHINGAHPSIKFTIETTENSGPIPFFRHHHHHQTERTVLHGIVHKTDVSWDHPPRRISTAVENQESGASLPTSTSHSPIQWRRGPPA